MSMPEQLEYLRTKLSRRRVLAGTAAGGGLLLGSASPAGAATPTLRRAPTLHTAPATAGVDDSLVAPFGRHLAFGADPKTQMRVSWQVPLAVKQPYLRVGLKPWELSRKIEAEVRALHTPSLSRKQPAVDQFYPHVALDGLKPGTTYYYGVGHDGFDPADASRISTIGSFRTAPARPETFVFTAFGDQGVSYHALSNDQLILGAEPVLPSAAGDICYADSSGLGKESDTYDARVWDQFLTQTESVASRLLVPRGGGGGLRGTEAEGVRARRERRAHRLLRGEAGSVGRSVAGGAAVVPAVEGSLQGGGGVLALGLARTGGMADAAAEGRLGHGDRLLEITKMISRRRKGRGACRRGCLHGGTDSRPPFAGSSETFGFYKAKSVPAVCLTITRTSYYLRRRGISAPG
ncbi:metallophosphoesterase family protein [Streptomyces sp. A3M-1-3]|nr:metallophosphoesterase family protein [Streptomyces sp. A3M-1-3]